MTATLRRLGPDDAEAFWALRLRAFREEPESFGSSYEESAGRPLAEVAAELAGNVVIGAFAPALVGIGGLRREARAKRRHRATLWGMYVAREARRGGVGRALVDEIIRNARALHGLEQILLTVIADNARAVELYRACGFVSYGRAPRALRVGDRALDEELMILELTAI